jgi:hypothetical protein
MPVKKGWMGAVLVLAAGACFGADPVVERPSPLLKPQDPPSLLPGETRPQDIAKPRLDLTPRHVLGQVRKYNLGQRSWTTNHDEGPPPQETKTQFAQKMAVKLTCLDATPGSVRYEVVHERYAVEATGVGKFDSAMEKDAPGSVLAAIYRPVVGVKLTIELDDDNVIRKVTGGESLGVGETAEKTRDVVSAVSLRQTVGPIFNGHRTSGEREVREQWKVEDPTVFDLGKFVLTTSYGLVSTTDDTAEIDLRGELAEEKMEGRGTSRLKVRPPSGVAGKLSWDSRNGWMNKYYLEQLYDIDAKAEGRDIWSTTQSQLLISLVDPKPRLTVPAAPAPAGAQPAPTPAEQEKSKLEDRPRGIPQPASDPQVPKQGEPKQAEPKQAEPKQGEPKVEPAKGEPK